MPEVRRIYRVNSSDLGELNRVLADMADRMDQLEGYRGQGRFLSPPTSDRSATSGSEVVRKSQLESEVSTILSSLDNYHPLGGSSLINLEADNLVTSEGLVVGGNAVIAGETQSGKVLITEDGGLAVSFIAGENLSKGHVVYIDQAGVADTVYLVPVNGDMPYGAVYEDATAGNSVWIVVAGIAYVMPAALVTAGLGHIATVTATAGQEGRVNSAATIPGVANHNREVGHFVEAGSGAGVIARAVLHFN